MSDNQASETQSIIPSQNGITTPKSLDDLKALFYLYNAKPDTEICFLTGGKIVELSDIMTLEEEVAAKLGNHETTGQTVSIAFTLANKRIKDFSTWAEFERVKWNTVNEKVDAISMNWNILIQLPQHKSPQTHSMKLRIGNAIPPKDIFQMMLTSDDISEVKEAISAGVCKVDFINTIVANELLFIVEKWYKGLKKVPEPELIQNLLKKYGKSTTGFIRYFFPLLILIIIFSYTDYLYPIIGIEKDLSLDSLQTSLIFLLGFFMVGSFVGSLIEKSIDKQIDKLEEYPNFQITKGDENAKDDFERKNKKLTKKISNKVLAILFAAPFNYFIKFLLDHFLKSIIN
jgi:hypothetical protein